MIYFLFLLAILALIQGVVGGGVLIGFLGGPAAIFAGILGMERLVVGPAPSGLSSAQGRGLLYRRRRIRSDPVLKEWKVGQGQADLLYAIGMAGFALVCREPALRIMNDQRTSSGPETVFGLLFVSAIFIGVVALVVGLWRICLYGGETPQS